MHARLLVPALVLAVAVAAPRLAAQTAEDDPFLWQLRLERAEMRLAHAEADLAHARRVFDWATTLPMDEETGRLAIAAPRDTGDYRTVSETTRRAELEVAWAQEAVTRFRLDLEEMRISERVPNTGLYAPLVGQRDFVTERMQARFAALSRQAEVQRARADVLQALVDTRAIPWRDLAARTAELEVTRSSRAQLELRMELRQLFLAGALPDDESFIREDESLTWRRSLAEGRLQRARVHLEQIEPLAGTGLASRVDLDAAQAEVRRHEQALETVDLDRRFYEHRFAVWQEARRSQGQGR
jgi:hypothetical protein